jgi:hypothetical protein
MRKQSMSSIAPDRGGRNSLAYVYDGQQCLGHVLARGKTGFDAFDRDDKCLGVFPTSAPGRERAAHRGGRAMSAGTEERTALINTNRIGRCLAKKKPGRIDVRTRHRRFRHAGNRSTRARAQ